MTLVDRRYLWACLVAWVVTTTWFLASVWPEIERLDNTSLWILGIAFGTFFGAVLSIIVFAIPLRIILNLAIKERRWAYREETICGAILLIAIVGYTAESERELRSLAPPKGITELKEFAQVMPAPQRLQLIEKDGRDYVVWTGQLAGPVAVTSGPSCYLFDDTGKLIDWQPDTGDGGCVEEFLKTATKQRLLTLEEALQFIGAVPAGA